MEITKTLYVRDRQEWRAWLDEHHRTEPEIWLIYPNKASGKQGIAYNDAVEEALCYGWIDGIAKKYDQENSAQRFTPRRRGSNWSELNKERVRLLIERGQMTEAGMAALGRALEKPFQIPGDILAAIKEDEQTSKHFEAFPESYKRIRIGYIEETRKRPEEFKKRLANFLKKTARNEMFGTQVGEAGRTARASE